MAATTSVVDRKDIDKGMVTTVDITLDNNYPTGGYTLGKLGLRIGKVDKIEAFADGYSFEWDTVNKKLLVYRVGATTAPQSEVPNATDLSAVVARATVYGR